MKKKMIIIAMVVVFVLVIALIFVFRNKSHVSEVVNTLTATVMASDDDTITLSDEFGVLYVFNKQDIEANLGDSLAIEYTGIIDKNKDIQSVVVTSYKVIATALDGIPSAYQDDGIFSKYYLLAYDKLQELSMDEKISQLLLVRYPDDNQVEVLKKNQFGGYLFFEKDFRNKTEDEVKKMIKELQDVAKVPILTAVDEEGGIVVRVSSNLNLASEKFKSSRELYNQGGLSLIRQDTINKSKLLNNLGLNLNLAPVVDVSTDPDDYMYSRSIGQNAEVTSEFAKTVIAASKDTGVSYTLKHFPGYGNNSDTHTGSSVDERSYNDIMNNDILPFKAGIDAGAEAVLVSHNIVSSIDENNPASLSASVHNLLRNNLGFTGIIITDDLAMGATSAIDDATVKAILAGNDLIITTDYQESIDQIKVALSDGVISEELINKLAFRILAWKYYKGMMFDSK